MSLLRIYGSLTTTPVRCHWVLLGDDHQTVSGEGPLSGLPGHAGRVQLVLPAAEVLLVRTRLPAAARRRAAGAALTYAIEDQTAGDPESNQVSWLGTAGNDDVLAVVDRQGLLHWGNALADAGIRAYEIHCETLLLPWQSGTWSLAWDGQEGIVRSGACEGGATDCGDRDTPPLSLQLMLDAARQRGDGPASITIHPVAVEVAPDASAWQPKLGVPLQVAGSSSWQTASTDAGISLAQERGHWRNWTGIARRLRPAGWIAAAAFAIHALALGTHWVLLDAEQRALRKDMETQFRTVFPEAVAVVDPALQMRRKLADARHAAGLPDEGDFLPMIELTSAALKELPAGSVRIISYESGRMTVEITSAAEAVIHRLLAQLRRSGLRVDTPASPRPGSGTLVFTVHPS